MGASRGTLRTQARDGIPSGKPNRGGRKAANPGDGLITRATAKALVAALREAGEDAAIHGNPPDGIYVMIERPNEALPVLYVTEAHAQMALNPARKEAYGAKACRSGQHFPKEVSKTYDYYGYWNVKYKCERCGHRWSKYEQRGDP